MGRARIKSTERGISRDIIQLIHVAGAIQERTKQPSSIEKILRTTERIDQVGHARQHQMVIAFQDRASLAFGELASHLLMGQKQVGRRPSRL